MVGFYRVPAERIQSSARQQPPRTAAVHDDVGEQPLALSEDGRDDLGLRPLARRARSDHEQHVLPFGHELAQVAQVLDGQRLDLGRQLQRAVGPDRLSQHIADAAGLFQVLRGLVRDFHVAPEHRVLVLRPAGRGAIRTNAVCPWGDATPTAPGRASATQHRQHEEARGEPERPRWSWNWKQEELVRKSRRYATTGHRSAQSGSQIFLSSGRRSRAPSTRHHPA